METSSKLLLLGTFVMGAACDSAGVPDAAPDAMTDSAISRDARVDTGDADNLGDVGIDGGVCEGVFVAQLRGSIVTEAGAPVPGARPQTCIRKHPDRALVCLEPPIADDAGAFTVDIPESLRCWSSAAIRILLPSGGFATTYCDVDPSPSVDGVLSIEIPYVLYAASPATTLPPLGDETAARAVIFDDGLEVEIVPERLAFDVDYDALSARRVPLGAEVPCFARGAGLVGIYGFGEEGAAVGEGFALRIPNPTALAAATSVELLLVGGLTTMLTDGTPVEEAELARFGSGTVSADGAFIVSDPGSELPYFTWLGYRVAP